MTPPALAVEAVDGRTHTGPSVDRFHEALAGRYGIRVAYTGTGGQALQATAEQLGALRPDVAVVNGAGSLADALALAERLDDTHPEIAVVLLADPTPEVWERALQAGVRRVITLDCAITELTDAVEGLLERIERQRANTVIDLRERDVSRETARPQGRVITVLSPKGGSGKTTVATNLAAGLAQVHPEKVAIVDLDVQFGDVADALLLAPSHTLADLTSAPDVDGAGVKLVLTRSEHGLYALCAPDDPATGEEVPLDAVARAIDALVEDFPFVVIDTGAGIDAAALTAVERSTDLLFVGSLDVPSIRSVRKLLHALDRLGMTEAARHVVLNRSDSDVGIATDDVVATLGLPISVELPSSRAIPASVNQGVPVVIADPASGVARSLTQLVGTFTEVAQPAPRRRSFRRTR